MFLQKLRSWSSERSVHCHPLEKLMFLSNPSLDSVLKQTQNSGFQSQGWVGGVLIHKETRLCPIAKSVSRLRWKAMENLDHCILLLRFSQLVAQAFGCWWYPKQSLFLEKKDREDVSCSEHALRSEGSARRKPQLGCIKDMTTVFKSCTIPRPLHPPW